MSYAAEFKVQGKWCDNGCRFATEGEAIAYAADKFMVWTMRIADDYRVVESADAPTKTYLGTSAERALKPLNSGE